MGQEKWGHKKLFTDPLPPSCNRDKLQFSGGELINTIWPLLIFPAKSSTLLHDIENLHYVRPQKMLQIVWKQKHQSEHGTCDKKILTPPSIRICPLFGELKKGDFFYPPSPLYGPMSPSQQFLFLLASLRRNTSCKDCTMLIVQFKWKIWKSFETRNMNKLFYW